MTIPTTWDHLPREDRRLRPDAYIYLIEFSFQTIKPGMTTSPRRRLREHYRDVARFGGDIVRWWVSPLHAAWTQNELTLLTAASATGHLRSGGSEYFGGCRFEDLLAITSSMDFAPTGQYGAEDDRITKRRRQVADRRDALWSIREIAEHVGVSVGTVHKDLIALGLSASAG